MTKPTLFACVEGGGTKFRCALIDAQGRILHETLIPTQAEAYETLESCARYFYGIEAEWGPFSALGIACFGPLACIPTAPDYGRILNTPKVAWRGVDLLGFFREVLGKDLPVGFDTDVNAAALAEAHRGAGRGLEHLVYVTVGTGIGMGLFSEGKCYHGAMHPEFGHMRIPHDFRADPFEGLCPTHGDCLEGLASGPAMALRWGIAPEILPDDHPAWDLEAHYLALMLQNVFLAYAPQAVVLGGGLMKQPGLPDRIREKTALLLGGYLMGFDPERAILGTALHDRAGLYGAFELALQASAE